MYQRYMNAFSILITFLLEESLKWLGNCSVRQSIRRMMIADERQKVNLDEFKVNTQPITTYIAVSRGDKQSLVNHLTSQCPIRFLLTWKEGKGSDPTRWRFRRGAAELHVAQFTPFNSHTCDGHLNRIWLMSKQALVSIVAPFHNVCTQQLDKATY